MNDDHREILRYTRDSAPVRLPAQGMTWPHRCLEQSLIVKIHFGKENLDFTSWLNGWRSARWNKKFWEELIAYFPWYDTGHMENDASNNSSIVACVFVTAVTFLRRRYLATIGGFLSSHCLATIGRIHRHARAHTHRQQRDLISLFLFCCIVASCCNSQETTFIFSK
jgi:hypothetical protein